MLLRFMVRLGMLGLAIWLIPMGAMDAALPAYYRMTGTVVDGEVIGFLAGRYAPSIQPESTAIRNGHLVARRPAFRYPAQPGGPATHEARAKTAFTLSFSPYALGEKVTVVFPVGRPENARMFEPGTLAGGAMMLGFGLLCAYIGLGGRL